MTRSAAPAVAPSVLDAHLPDPDFSERHERTVAAPAGAVWAAALAVSAREVRLLAPFVALRSLPRLLTGGPAPRRPARGEPFLEVFVAEGFVELRRDPVVSDGRACVVYGAAGRFWSPTGSSGVRFEDAAAYAAHDGPGTAKGAFSIEVVADGDRTLLTTETRVVGTDPASRRAFGRYWLIIRGPSGLIRRSWLAAIDRRARA